MANNIKTPQTAAAVVILFVSKSIAIFLDVVDPPASWAINCGLTETIASAVFRRSQSFKLRFRITAAVLLAVIAWGSTVEVTHGHAAAGANQSAEKTRNSIQTDALEQGSPTSVEENEPAKSSSRPTTSSECLICQLHHNLATTLLSQPASIDALHQQAARSSTPERLHLREFTTVQHGRAPPISFL